MLAIITSRKIIINKTVEAILIGLSILKAKSSFFLRITIPIDTGITVITRIWIIVWTIGSSIIASVSPEKYAIASDNIIGIVKTVIKLARAVKVTERPIFPLETCVIKLLVGPPGHKESIIIPIAIVESRSNKRIIKNPIKGRNTSWLNRPIKISLG